MARYEGTIAICAALVLAGCAPPGVDRDGPHLQPPEAVAASPEIGAAPPPVQPAVPPLAPLPTEPAAVDPGPGPALASVEPQPGVPVASLPLAPPGPLYVCIATLDGQVRHTAIEFEPKARALCRRHPEMGVCQYAREACRASGGRVFAADGVEITRQTEAEYDKKVLRLRLHAG